MSQLQGYHGTLTLMNNGVENTKSVIGSIIGNGPYNTTQTAANRKYKDTFYWYDELSPFSWSPYVVDMYLSKQTKSNFAESLERQIGMSISEYANLLVSDLDTMISANQTGHIRSLSGEKGVKLYSNLKGAILKKGSYYVIPWITMQLTSNYLPPNQILRRVGFNIEFYYVWCTWNGTTLNYDSSSNAFSRAYCGDVLWDGTPGPIAKEIIGWCRNVNAYWGVGLSSENAGSGQKYYTHKLGWLSLYLTQENQPITEESPGLSKLYQALHMSSSFSPAWGSPEPVDPEDPFIEPDPYPPGPGPTPPGPVTPDDPDDPPVEPDFPIIDGASVGIYTAFKVSASTLRNLASVLWNPSAWDAIKQMFTNPMDAIFGLSIVPVNPLTAGTPNIFLGRYDTQIPAPRIENDYVNVDCGSVLIHKFYGSYLDHDPYTKYSIYLPYVGEMDLNADEITGKTLSVKYHCNVITGDVVALILLNEKVCYSGMGNFARQLPLSQTDFSSIIQTAVSAASTLLTAAVAGAGAGEIAALQAEAGNAVGERAAMNRVSSSMAHGSSSLVGNVMNTKFNYKHSGKIGQGAGQLGVQVPFITVTRPNLALPEDNDASQSSNLKAYTGYPCNKIVQFSNCHGFTQVEATKLRISDATDEEVAELYELLRGGVLF